jgi:hypothetical protein
MPDPSMPMGLSSLLQRAQQGDPSALEMLQQLGIGPDGQPAPPPGGPPGMPPGGGGPPGMGAGPPPGGMAPPGGGGMPPPGGGGMPPPGMMSQALRGGMPQ